jgi:hypothetical protein
MAASAQTTVMLETPAPQIIHVILFGPSNRMLDSPPTPRTHMNRANVQAGGSHVTSVSMKKVTGGIASPVFHSEVDHDINTADPDDNRNHHEECNGYGFHRKVISHTRAAVVPPRTTHAPRATATNGCVLANRPSLTSRNTRAGQMINQPRQNSDGTNSQSAMVSGDRAVIETPDT